MDLISLIICTLFVVLIITAIISTYHQYILRRKLKNIPVYGRFPFGVTFELLKLTNYGEELYK